MNKKRPGLAYFKKIGHFVDEDKSTSFQKRDSLIRDYPIIDRIHGHSYDAWSVIGVRKSAQ